MNSVPFRIILPVFLLLVSVARAQDDLRFEKRFVESEDKWVVFQRGEDGKYVLGFIYIDQQAGLTLNYECLFTISDKNQYVREVKPDSQLVAYKVRLKNNNVKVAWLPAARFAELHVADPPSWLGVYKSYTDTAARLQRWGYYYNDWGMSEKALEYLEPGYKRAPAFKDMATELGFAYNALEQFDKAIPVLEKAAELTPEDGYVYKELSYAYLSKGDIEAGAKAAESGVKYYDDNRMKAEIAHNVAYHYYLKKDKKQFARWAAESKKWAEEGSEFAKRIDYMQKKLEE